MLTDCSCILDWVEHFRNITELRKEYFEENYAVNFKSVGQWALLVIIGKLLKVILRLKIPSNDYSKSQTVNDSNGFVQINF